MSPLSKIIIITGAIGILILLHIVSIQTCADRAKSQCEAITFCRWRLIKTEAQAQREHDKILKEFEQREGKIFSEFMAADVYACRPLYMR